MTQEQFKQLWDDALDDENEQTDLHEVEWFLQHLAAKYNLTMPGDDLPLARQRIERAKEK